MKCIIDNQTKDLKLEKNKKRLSQMRKEKSAKRKLENARKKESKLLKKNNLRIACKHFIGISFLNLKVVIIFVTLNKLKILLELMIKL